MNIIPKKLVEETFKKTCRRVYCRPFDSKVCTGIIHRNTGRREKNSVIQYNVTRWGCSSRRNGSPRRGSSRMTQSHGSWSVKYISSECNVVGCVLFRVVVLREKYSQRSESDGLCHATTQGVHAPPRGRNSGSWVHIQHRVHASPWFSITYQANRRVPPFRCDMDMIQRSSGRVTACHPHGAVSSGHSLFNPPRE